MPIRATTGAKFHCCLGCPCGSGPCPCPCPWGQVQEVLVLVLVLGGQVFVLVLGGQVLVNIPANSRQLHSSRTHMQFLAARSRWTNLFSAKYSMPSAHSRDHSVALPVRSPGELKKVLRRERDAESE